MVWPISLPYPFESDIRVSVFTSSVLWLSCLFPLLSLPFGRSRVLTQGWTSTERRLIELPFAIQRESLSVRVTLRGQDWDLWSQLVQLRIGELFCPCWFSACHFSVCSWVFCCFSSPLKILSLCSLASLVEANLYIIQISFCCCLDLFSISVVLLFGNRDRSRSRFYKLVSELGEGFRLRSDIFSPCVWGQV